MKKNTSHTEEDIIEALKYKRVVCDGRYAISGYSLTDCTFYVNDNNELHRENDKPAIIYNSGSLCWFRNGKLHRDNDMPAVITDKGKRQDWFINGIRHRDNNRPAIIVSGKMVQWWVNGVTNRTEHF